MSKFGGVDPSQIAAITKEPPSENAGASAGERFVRTVTTLVERRYMAGEEAGLSIFIRSQTIADDIKGRHTAPLPLVCNGTEPISRKIVISDTLLGRAYTLAMAIEANIFEVLEGQGFGQHQTLVVDWRGTSPKAMYWPHGIANGEPVDLYLSDHEITPVEMKEILDDFYKARLRTPQTITEGHGQRVWENSSRGWPSERPEERIQGILISFLRGRLRHDIRPELPNAEGRLDVQISARLHDGNGSRIVKKIWILELKALTDKTTSGEDVPSASAIAGLEKGVTQAYSYREAEHANRAALCCFDMRKDDIGNEATFAPILDEANDNSVHLWRWFLFRSSHAARTAHAAAQTRRSVTNVSSSSSLPPC